MRSPWLAAAAALLLVSAPAAAQPANPAGLRIVVIAGEDAVNIIQQKTAVAPIVEVRDRNNLPVAGATVTFSLGPGASFGGQSTLTVVTNAAGQATATGLTPSAAGALQIQATATFQGQTAVATIAQSNVMTAAEAASAASTAGGGGSGSGGAAGAAGAGGGAAGGLSGTMIGVIGAAAAGGVVVATKAAGGSESSSPSATSTTSSGTTGTGTTTNPTPPSTPTPQPTSSAFSGPMAGTMTGTSSVEDGGINCTYSVRTTGNSTLRLQTASSGAITGTLEMNGTNSAFSINCTGGTSVPIPDAPFVYSAAVIGTGNTVGSTQEFRDTITIEGISITVATTIRFTGTISGNTVTGTLVWNSTADTRGPGGSVRGAYTGTINLTLNRG